MTTNLQYPIGKFSAPEVITTDLRDQYIKEIAALPRALTHLVEGFTEDQLDTPYREQGWTVRQLLHHIPDSHANSYIRFKWTLTEDTPTIKAYYEDRWATLPDSYHTPVSVSLQWLDLLHQRWVTLMQHMTEEDWNRAFVHPETKAITRLDTAAGMYAWHGKHHLAHIQNLANRMKWKSPAL